MSESSAPEISETPASKSDVNENDVSAPPKNKGGRPRKRPGPEPSGREARKYLERNSGYLDMLCRMIQGKAIKRKGPTGKVLWHHPEWEDQKWALAQVLPRMIPTLASQELTGDPENPLTTSMDDFEISRRVASLLYRGDNGLDEPARGESPGHPGNFLKDALNCPVRKKPKGTPALRDRGA